ncbi:MAG: hypothetical protein ACRC1W_14945 [Shewanella sp.]
MNVSQLKAALSVKNIISYDDSMSSVTKAVLASDDQAEALRQWAFDGMTASSSNAWTNSLDDEGNTTWSIEEARLQLEGHIDCCSDMLAGYPGNQD